MLKKSGSIDEKRGRFFPLIYWTKENVMNYMRVKNLVLPREYEKIHHSFRSLSDEDVSMVKEFSQMITGNCLNFIRLLRQRHFGRSSDVRSKFQAFDSETISRSQIKNAPYNPRIMNKETKKD